MNPMYDCSGSLDRFGGITEPPEPMDDEEPDWQRPDEADAVCWDCWGGIIWTFPNLCFHRKKLFLSF